MFNDALVKTAKQLTAYCQSGDEAKGLETLYAPDCVSVEALAMPGGPEIEGMSGRETKGVDAIRRKHDWWYENNEVHSSGAEGPFLHGDNSFSILFDMDVTDKTRGERVQMKEVGLYTTNSDGKIVREEFYYPPFE